MKQHGWILRVITLGAVSLTEKDRNSDFTHMWNIKQKSTY